MLTKKPTRKWWAAYKALHAPETGAGGAQLALPMPKVGVGKKTASQASNCPFEQAEHFRAAAWLRKQGIRFHHSPNGEKRDALVGMKLKQMGTSPGFPDFEIPLPRKGYHGLYIELKRVFGGGLSEAQREWRDYLIKEGYCWHMARGSDDLIQFVEKYLG